MTLMTDLSEYVLNEVLKEEILGVAYEIHRALVKGTFFLDDNEITDDSNYKIVVENGYDVFGQPLSGVKKTVECKCPSCHRNLAAVRFAPHLEKCMGMGRNSSRIASQRIANSGKISSGASEALGLDDDADDANDSDWSREARKTKKRKNAGTNSNGSSPRAAKASLTTKPAQGSVKNASLPCSLRLDNSQLNSTSRTMEGNYNSFSSNMPNPAWQNHLNANSMGQDQNAGTDVAPSRSGVSGIRRSKKSSKAVASKKSKKKQLSSSQRSFDAT